VVVDVHSRGPEFRQRILAGEVLFGSFLNLGSPLTAEIMALSGLGWIVIDLEHGAGGEQEALAQLHAVGHTGTATIVRVESLARPRIHRALDLGAAGVLVPRIDTLEEARLAVAYCRYSGLRGVARGNRAWQWSPATHTEFGRADAEVVCCIQVETKSAFRSVEEIAAVEGVDVLFVGPGDLAYALGIDGGPEHPDLLEAAASVLVAARTSKKAAGILVETVEQAAVYCELGFTFIGCSSDGTLLAREGRRLVEGLNGIARHGAEASPLPAERPRGMLGVNRPDALQERRGDPVSPGEGSKRQ
jgi:2-keto-3-deoxy-L-rhamnonate aldolase RhmA